MPKINSSPVEEVHVPPVKEVAAPSVEEVAVARVALVCRSSCLLLPSKSNDFHLIDFFNLKAAI